MRNPYRVQFSYELHWHNPAVEGESSRGLQLTLRMHRHMVHVDGWPPGEVRGGGSTDNAVWIVNGGGGCPGLDRVVRSEHSGKHSDQVTVLDSSADALPQVKMVARCDGAVFRDDVGEKFVHI